LLIRELIGMRVRDVKQNKFLYTGRKQSSGMWRRVDIVLTDVSDERIASIFRVEEKKSASKEPA
jgi:hypothetical protein